MKKNLSLLIALSIICLPTIYASPELVCPSTIKCEIFHGQLQSCRIMPAGWRIGNTGIDTRTKDGEHLLYFTGAQIDEDNLGHCDYIDSKEQLIYINFVAFGLVGRNGPALAWEPDPYPYKIYKEYCFSDYENNTIPQDPAYCLFSPNTN